MHQHALIFTNEGKAKKAKKKLKKELSDSTTVGDEGVTSDSTQTATLSKKEKRKRKKKKDKDEGEVALTEEEKMLLAESGESIEPVEKKKEKRKKKKRGKEEGQGAETDEGLTEEEKAILEEENMDDADDLKLSPREIRKADREARAEEKRAKKEEKEKDPFNVAYRSRITPWWGKDQHPEVGEDWKPTKKVYEQPDQRKARKLFRNLFGYPTR